MSEIPNLPKIFHINLRANLIEKLDEFHNLKPLISLKSITMHENPVATELGDGVRKEIIMIL